jgi:hypothetical protein
VPPTSLRYMVEHQIVYIRLTATWKAQIIAHLFMTSWSNFLLFFISAKGSMQKIVSFNFKVLNGMHQSSFQKDYGGILTQCFL